MASPYTHYPAYDPNLAVSPSTPNARGRGRGAQPIGAKRGRKPRSALPQLASPSRPPSAQLPTTSTPTPVHWPQPPGGPSGDQPQATSVAPPDSTMSDSPVELDAVPSVQLSAQTSQAAVAGRSEPFTAPPIQPIAGQIVLNPNVQLPRPGVPAPVDEDGEGDDELLPAMADDDYSAQLSRQNQSKDNNSILINSLSPEQYDRFEAYRRHPLPKQAIRKVIQQTLGQQVSQPVAQVIAGFAKVFVGEMVERARAVQARRRETGPLSPDHLREAYRVYQNETGRVGAARPLRAKRLFVR